MKLQSVTYMNTNQPCQISDFKDGLIAVFAGKIDSEMFSIQYANYLDQVADLEQASIQVLFVSDQNETTEEDHKLCDINREILNLDPELAKHEDVSDFLFILRKDGDNLTHVLSRRKPENEVNWIEYLVQFVANYKDVDPDADGLWRVGQIVPKTGEYLCVDCGYIEELQEGSVFPVCEVCLSGDPEGPSLVEKGYWEYLG